MMNGLGATCVCSGLTAEQPDAHKGVSAGHKKEGWCACRLCSAHGMRDECISTIIHAPLACFS